MTDVGLRQRREAAEDIGAEAPPSATDSTWPRLVSVSAARCSALARASANAASRAWATAADGSRTVSSTPSTCSRAPIS